MNINFFDDPDQAPRVREEVRFQRLGFYVHPPDGRRIAVGFDITPFIERPSIEVAVTNAVGEKAGSLTVIQTLATNFHLTLHLRDRNPTDTYTVEALLYYTSPEEGRLLVDRLTAALDVSRPGQEFFFPA